MKKKVFSLMMMLLLAVTGFVRAGEITVHDGSNSNAAIPVWGTWADNNLQHEFVYPAEELVAMNGGEISTLKFYSTSSYANVSWNGSFQVFLKEVGASTITSFLGNSDATLVYEGSLSVASREMEITFATPYTYHGGNLWIGVYYTATTGYSSCSWQGESATSAAVYGRSGNGYTLYTANFLPKTTFTYTGGGLPVDEIHVKYMNGEEEVIDALDLGIRPVGAWMAPFEFTMYSSGPNYTVNVLDFTPSDGMFTVSGEELPFQVVLNNDVALNMITNGTEAGVIERQFVAITEGDRAAHIWPVTVELYDPAIPDVWEKACTQATTFPFVEVPATAHNTTLHNDYTLPFPEIEEGVDAVYKLVFTQDQMLNAEVISGENGKVALYTQDFYGEGGPMATNYYQGLVTSTRSRDELTYNFDDNSLQGWTAFQGNNTTSPHGWITGAEHYYGLAGYGHNDSQGFVLSESYITGENLSVNPDNYLVSPLVSIGNGSMINFWASDANDLYGEEHFTVEVSTTSNNNAAAFTPIFETTLLRGQGQRTGRALRDVMNDGVWYEYTVDLSAYAGQQAYVAFHHFNCYDQWFLAIDDVTITTGTPGGGGGGGISGEIIAGDFTSGPEIEGLAVTPGTYYLVASSTTPDFQVRINAEQMPCPPVEGFAFDPTPADDADGLQPASVTLSWTLPNYTTSWRLVFGTTYYPEASHPQTIITDWSNDLAQSYTVTNLWNNTNYFWHIEMKNDGCPGGVSSPIWGFTTTLNIPQNLQVNDNTIYEGDDIVLTWNPVADRTYRRYYIYQDGVKIGETDLNNINATTYTVRNLAYNMTGYEFYVTAVYDEGESAPSNTVSVQVTGMSAANGINGHVYEQDGVTGIAGATVTVTGIDEFNTPRTYTFTTNAQGYYQGQVLAGVYNTAVASKEGYQSASTIHELPFTVAYHNHVDDVDFILDENFDGPCTVIADYYPDSLDPQSPYVKVYWGCGLSGAEAIVEPFETGDFSQFDWQLDGTYPWIITTTNPYEGSYCMKSGNAGVESSTSTMSVTVNIPADGEMSFFGKISSESNYDYGHFYIDGVEKGNWSGSGNWAERTYDITAGDHTFLWSYSKDYSVNNNDDCFYVDNITFFREAEPAPSGTVYDFDDGTMQGWTTFQGSNTTSPHSWMPGAQHYYGLTGYGHNESAGFVLSESYITGENYAVTPDNYLVSPLTLIENGSVLNFWASDANDSYGEEHFSVEISTTANNNAAAFTSIFETTLLRGKGQRTGREMRDVMTDGVWYEYNVDLSAYAGQQVYIAFHHFDCYDQWFLAIDDVMVTSGAKGNNDRAFSHYRVYRTNCYNDGPYTPDNTVVLACELHDTLYIDVSWPDAAPGVYKWGVGCVYVGNRGEEIEGPIHWAEMNTPSRNVTFTASVDPNANTNVGRARDGWLAYDDGTYASSVGNSTAYDWTWGVMYPASMLGNSTTLSKVAIYNTSYNVENITIDIYQGGTSEPGTLIATQTVTPTEGLQEVTLTSPVTIDPSQNLWITLTEHGTYVLTACNTTEPNNQWVENDGWYNIGDLAPTLAGYGWMIRAYVEDSGTPTPPSPGTGGSQLVDFENGNVPSSWVNDSNYPWVIWNTDAYSGSNCLASSNYNVSSSESYIEATVQFVADGSIEFYSRISSELNYDYGKFYIDGTQQLSESGSGNWASHNYNVTAGTHTFRWSYTKDTSVNGYDDRYYVDNVTFNGVAAGGTDGLQEPRESEIVWSNCLDKDMFLGENEVNITVLLNSADSPEGARVSFENYNESEQELYPVEDVVLDGSGFYAWETFRKGNYKLTLTMNGYEPIEDSVSIWDVTSLRYVMIEIIYGVSDLYVSRTGWAMWNNLGAPSGGGQGGGGGQGSGATSFTEGFEGSLNGWNVLTVNAAGGHWLHSDNNPSGYEYASHAHGGSGFAMCYSFIDYDGAYDTDSYLYTPQKYDIVNGSTLTFFADNANDSYPESFSVCVATADNPTASDFVTVWSGSAKGNDGAKANVRHDGNRYDNWRSHSVNLSAYAGQSVWIAFHDVNYDMYEVWIDDVQLTAGAKKDNVAFTASVDPNANTNIGRARDGWLAYDDGTYATSIGNSTAYDWTWGVMYPASMLGSNNTLSKVAIYNTSYNEENITINIYQGGTSEPGTLIASQTVAPTEGLQEVTLTSPVAINPSQNLWITLTEHGTYVLTACNTTEPNNQWVENDGWYNIGDLASSLAGYGWMIRAYVEQGATPPPTPAEGILGAMIFVDGEWEAFVEAPTNTYTYDGDGENVCVRIVYDGTNELPANNFYYAMSCEECAEHEGGTCEPGAPIHAEVLGTDQVKIWWGTEPAAPIEDWLYYDDGMNVDAIGLQSGGSFYWGIKFPAASLTQYVGCSVTKIGYFDYTAHTGVVRIYQGSNGNGPSSNMIGSYNYTANGTEDWIEWTIPAVAFDNTQDLWIVMNNTTGQYVAAMGNYTGDPNGTMLSTDGSTWYTLNEATGGSYDYTWNLRCFVTNQAKGNAEVVEMPLPTLEGGVIANAGVSKQGNAPAYIPVRSQIVKYNVYRSNDAAGTYDYLGFVAEDGSGYYEYIDTPNAAGTYYYQVTAVYDNDCESDPAPAFDDPTHSYVSASVDAVGENSDMVALYPNPTKGNVTIEANGMSRITVVSVLGQVVFDTELNADVYTLNMAQFNAGMYLVRVYTEEGVVVKRVTVMQ